MTSVEISDPFELMVLHKAIMHAKFPDAGEPDSVLLGSPLLAAIANRVVDALDTSDPTKPPKSWSAWLANVEGFSRALEIVRSAISRCEPWNKWSDGEKRTYICIMLSPLRPSDELVTLLMRDS